MMVPGNSFEDEHLASSQELKIIPTGVIGTDHSAATLLQSTQQSTVYELQGPSTSSPILY